MDTFPPNPAQSVVQPAQQQDINQTVVPVSDQPLTLDTIDQPASSANPAQSVIANNYSGSAQQQYSISPRKEAGPVIQAPLSEFIKPTEVTPQLRQEVIEAGLEALSNPEQPLLTREHKAVGIEPAKEAVPVEITAQPALQLPYPPDQVEEIKKKVSSSESRHWLAVLTEFLFKKLQGVKS